MVCPTLLGNVSMDEENIDRLRQICEEGGGGKKMMLRVRGEGKHGLCMPHRFPHLSEKDLILPVPVVTRHSILFQLKPHAVTLQTFWLILN